MKVVHWIFCLCLFTASFDLLGTVQVGGVLHIAQLGMIFVCFAGLARIIQESRILWPRGTTSLAIWVFWQGLCLSLAGNLDIAVQFYLLLLFTAAGYFLLIQIYGESQFVGKLMRAYLWSYIFVAFYGLLQALGPLFFHATMPFTAQWLVHGRVARINAFSYEPSYFATYIFLGYVTLVDLRLSDAEITRTRTMKWATWMVAVVLVLSTSKSAFICVIADLLVRVAPRVGRRLRRTFSQLRFGRFLVPIPSLKRVLMVVLVLGILGTAIVLLPDPTILLAGSGLAGTPAHSYADRNQRAGLTWAVIKESPLMGRSMGGVPIAIGNNEGFEVATMARVRAFWGFPVLLDVLAGSGVIGFIPFLLFLWASTFGAYRLAKQCLPLEGAKWLRALARAMILEWVMLLTDQNLFRVYLWFHFAMVAIVAYHLEFGYAAVPVPDPAFAPATSFILENTPDALGVQA
jgi:hypothetical protein